MYASAFRHGKPQLQPLAEKFLNELQVFPCFKMNKYKLIMCYMGCLWFKITTFSHLLFFFRHYLSVWLQTQKPHKKNQKQITCKIFYPEPFSLLSSHSWGLLPVVSKSTPGGRFLYEYFHYNDFEDIVFSRHKYFLDIISPGL